jgi:hypothetical protein
MPFKSPLRPTLSSSYRSDACTTASSPQAPSSRMLVDDQELVQRVRNASAAVALKRALTDPVASWEAKKKTPSVCLGPSSSDHDGFSLSSRALGANGEGYEVLSVGDIACSPQELASVLCSRNESDYNAAMKGLYGGQFIYGSIVHVAEGSAVVPAGHQLAVRTGCFARSRLLARNEQWCFLEYFQPTHEADKQTTKPDTSQGFSVSLLSLPEQELAVGKAVGGRVDQLDGVTALLVVDVVPGSEDSSAAKVASCFTLSTPARTNLSRAKRAPRWQEAGFWLWPGECLACRLWSGADGLAHRYSHTRPSRWRTRTRKRRTRAASRAQKVCV